MMMINCNDSRDGLGPSALTSSPILKSDRVGDSTSGQVLPAVASIDCLIEHEKEIISALNNIAKSVGATPEQNHQAHHLTVYGRQSQLSLKVSNVEEQKGTTFDRTIYLLDRYLDFCRSVELIAWPIHHLKVSIWLQNVVISAVKNSRMKPLRKTVRCYVTTLQAISVRTVHLFSGHIGDHLMQSPLIQEILNSLPCERDNLPQRLGIAPESSTNDQHRVDPETDRDRILALIRTNSGDDKAEEAMAIVTAARASNLSVCADNSPPSSPLNEAKRKYKPDPHLHTLRRYRNFCFINKIPFWPIEPLRVSLWLRESVLVGGSRQNEKKMGVSLRTVQVYLSRLEFARIRTEDLWREKLGTSSSLYKSPEIIEILHALGSTPDHVDSLSLKTTPVSGSPLDDKVRSSEPSSPRAIRAISKLSFDGHIQTPELSNSVGDKSSQRGTHKRKLDHQSAMEDDFSFTVPLKHARMIKTDADESQLVHSAESGLHEHTQRLKTHHLCTTRSFRGRKTPPPSIRTDRKTMSRVELYSPITPSGPRNVRIGLPSISDWFELSKSPSPVKKGCISFILCPDEDSDLNFTDHSNRTEFSPDASPKRLSAQSSEFTLSPLSLHLSPHVNRFWPPHATSNVRDSRQRQ